jgi:hypothetical protein
MAWLILLAAAGFIVLAAGAVVAVLLYRVGHRRDD